MTVPAAGASRRGRGAGPTGGRARRLPGAGAVETTAGWLAAVLVALAVGGASLASEASGPPFRLLSADTATALARQVAVTHAAGYRPLASAVGTGLNGKDRFVVLMQQRADAAEWAVAVARSSADFDAAVGGRSVNDLGEEGYRLVRADLLASRLEDWWVPERSYVAPLTLVLERPPDAVPVRYTSLTITSAEEIDEKLSRHAAAGHRVVGIWNGGRSLYVVVEEPLAAAEPTRPEGREASAEEPPLYRLLIGENPVGLRVRVDLVAGNGYRVVDVVDASIQAPPIVLMRHEPSPEGTYRYALMYDAERRIHRDKLEAKLNKRGRKGYRVAPRAITPGVLVFERPPGKSRRFEFLALSSKHAPGLPRALASALEAGYRFQALLASGDETIAVVERTTSPPSP